MICAGLPDWNPWKIVPRDDGQCHRIALWLVDGRSSIQIMSWLPHSTEVVQGCRSPYGLPRE
jgi:hypothetical protein